MLDWTVLRVSGVLVSRVYAGMNNQERARVRRDAVRNTRLLDWGRTPGGDLFRRAYLMALPAEEFSQVVAGSRKISSGRRPRAPYRPPRGRKTQDKAPERLELLVGRTHRPCGACGLLVPAAKGCVHWRPQNKSGLPRDQMAWPRGADTPVIRSRDRRRDERQRAHLAAQLADTAVRSGPR